MSVMGIESEGRVWGGVEGHGVRDGREGKDEEEEEEGEEKN